MQWLTSISPVVVALFWAVGCAALAVAMVFALAAAEQFKAGIEAKRQLAIEERRWFDTPFPIELASDAALDAISRRLEAKLDQARGTKKARAIAAVAPHLA
jgi:hypothetical protein